jgi:hypothetical protein
MVLNLNHDEIKRLVRLSESAPALAGHWAMAMCLNERGGVLGHLTPEAREDLLIIDAMARCGSGVPEPGDPPKKGGSDDEELRAFLRDIRSSQPRGRQDAMKPGNTKFQGGTP